MANSQKSTPWYIIQVNDHSYTPEEAAVEMERLRRETEQKQNEREEWIKNNPNLKVVDIPGAKYYTSKGLYYFFFKLNEEPLTLEEAEEYLKKKEEEEKQELAKFLSLLRTIKR